MPKNGHSGHEKSPGQKGTGLFSGQPVLKETGQADSLQYCLPCKLLRRLSGWRGGSSGCSSVGSCLVSIGAGRSGAVGSIGGRGGSVGGSSVGSRCRLRHDYGCRCFHWSGNDHGSGLFLLAASGEGSNSDQRGQNERFVHFKIPCRQTDKNGCHGAQPLTAGIRSGRVRVSAPLHQPTIILSQSQFWLTLTLAANGVLATGH